ncbi:MAG: hypothetical protein IJI49_00975 [Bacilli bacterium]|nr:hypothetical protein [Bacilli bacterium]
MNREIRELFDNNNIIIDKITIKSSVLIIDSGSNKYVVKKKNTVIDSLYRYLRSRNFYHFPNILYETDNYSVFEYINGINIPNEEASVDIIKLCSLLHSKTTFYKDVDEDYYKKIYEDVIDRINYLYNYYDDFANIIDSEEYMSPSNYYFIRNVSLLFSNLNFCRYAIEEWLKLIKEKKRIRVVNLHNNLSLDHFLLSDKSYFISWEKSKRDMPIYDLINFYKKYYDDFDFSELFGIYESFYPLLREEKLLLLCLISIPDKLLFNDNEYDMCNNINNFYNYIKASLRIVEDNKKIIDSKE